MPALTADAPYELRAHALVKFCQQRVTTVLSPRDADLFQNWLLDLLAARVPPPLTERD